MSLPFPEGTYELYADDDDVIGVTVARTYPSGWPIVCTSPLSMTAFDEFEVGQFIAKCLTHHDRVLAFFDAVGLDGAS